MRLQRVRPSTAPLLRRGLSRLNVVIAVTGNYTFFNLLSIILCVFLLDDDVVQRLPGKVRRVIRSFPTLTLPMGILTGATAVLAAFVLIVGGLQMWGTFDGKYPSPTSTAMRWIAPFHTVNGYGLFAIMTTTRPEIIVEGSNDGVEWRSYEFKHKAGDPFKTGTLSLHRTPPARLADVVRCARHRNRNAVSGLNVQAPKRLPNVLSLLREPVPEARLANQSATYLYTFSDPYAP